MADKYIMVRLLRSTKARLEAVRQSMLLGAEVGLRTFEVDNRDRVSLDQIINAMIDAREQHAERRRRSASNRRKRKQPAELAGPELAGPAIEVSRERQDLPEPPVAAGADCGSDLFASRSEAEVK